MATLSTTGSTSTRCRTRVAQVTYVHPKTTPEEIEGGPAAAAAVWLLAPVAETSSSKIARVEEEEPAYCRPGSESDIIGGTAAANCKLQALSVYCTWYYTGYDVQVRVSSFPGCWCAMQRTHSAKMSGDDTLTPSRAAFSGVFTLTDTKLLGLVWNTRIYTLDRCTFSLD